MENNVGKYKNNKLRLKDLVRQSSRLRRFFQFSTNTHTNTHTHTHTYIYIYIHTYKDINMCTHTHVLRTYK